MIITHYSLDSIAGGSWMAHPNFELFISDIATTANLPRAVKGLG